MVILGGKLNVKMFLIYRFGGFATLAKTWYVVFILHPTDKHLNCQSHPFLWCGCFGLVPCENAEEFQTLLEDKEVRQWLLGAWDEEDIQ